MTSRFILHFDMNSYFASVEQQANPKLRGRPVGIAATMAPGGCMIATSREAKALGIVTGMRVKDGLRIYPALKVVEVDPPKYHSTTEAIFRIMAEYSEDIEPYSIDEAFVDFTGDAASLEEVAQIGETFRQRILSEVGEWLRCSIGVAPTRWLAKFASDTAPKGGTVVLERRQVPSYLAGRPVTEAWGINKGFERRLHALGIFTLEDLYRYPVTNLMEALGVRGYELWANVQGIELGGVQEERDPKSIGHTHVLRERTRDHIFHRAVLMKLCEKTARELRQKNLEAHGIWAMARSVPSEYTRMAEGASHGGQRKLGDGVREGRKLFQLAWEMLEPEVHGQVLTFLGVGTFALRPKSGQLKLWPEVNHDAVEAVIDQVHERYGAYMLRWGAMWNVRKHAQERVGFRKTIAASAVLHDNSPRLARF